MSETPKLEIVTKPSESTKPDWTKAQVIALHLQGISNRKIAIELGMSRSTVAKILVEADVSQFKIVEDTRLTAIDLAPEAMENVAKAVREGNLKASLALLKGIGVFSDKLVIEEAEAVDSGEVPSYFAEASNAGTTHQPN